jgi:hypothetical protein
MFLEYLHRLPQLQSAEYRRIVNKLEESVMSCGKKLLQHFMRV